MPPQRSTVLLPIAALSAALVLSACTTDGGAGGDDGSVRIGTAGEGGTYYYLGTAFAQELRDEAEITADSVATAGGTENIRRVGSGDLDLAFATIDDFKTVMADDEWSEDDFTTLGTGHLTVQQPVVAADSGITTLEEMAQPDNRLAVGEPGSAVQLNAALLLGAYEVGVEDVNGFEISQAAAAEELKNGQLDGAYLGGGVPLAAITDLTTSGSYRVLPADQKTIDYWSENTAYVETTIPAGSYDGQEEDLTAIGQPTVLVVSSEMSEELAHDIIEVFQTRGPEMGDVHPAATEYTVENAFRDRDFIEDEAGLSYHPGAIKWYEENDAWEEE
ncbi:TAXI family TRAP transporter solute-binding subunit [Aeromicrobium sp. CTD01-1L150]|uniref:TAXI family TRAP transporter solute-binding subunit n=1 Tax=Aeromicrobium sp. CTD01-1L150 TaxID=3341830 RepID=UPI0035BF5D73